MSTTPSTTYPGFTLEAAFGTGADVAAVSWTDLSTRLRHGSIDRGRQRETDQFRAGEARFTLNNRDRMLDPEYSAGTWFGQILPGVQIRLKATYNSIVYTLFYGYAEVWSNSYPGQDADSVCELLAIDCFSWLALAPLPDSVWAFTVKEDAPAAWWRLGEQLGTIMGDSGGSGHHGAYSAPVTSSQQGIVPYPGNSGALLFDGLDDRATAPADSCDTVSGGELTVEFWMKTDLVPTVTATIINSYNTGAALQFGVALLADGTIGTSGLKSGQTVVNDNRPHHIVVTRTAVTFIDTIYVDGVADTLPGAASVSFGVNIGTYIGQTPTVDSISGEQAYRGYLDEIVLYDYRLTAGQVAAHYAAGTAPWAGDTSGGRFTHILDSVGMVGWPGSLRDLDAGESVLGPTVLGGNALDYLQVAGQTEAGLFYATTDGKVRLVGRGNLLTEATYSTSGATFGDGGGVELSYHDITVDPSNAQQIKNVGHISRQGGVTQEYIDGTSSSTYGPREISQSGLLMASDNEALDRATALVFRLKDPGFRVDSLTITPGRSPSTLFPKVLAYDLGQKLTVKRRPQAIGSAISQDVHIEGITHEFDAPTKTWVTVYLTAPTDPNEDNWCIVDSGLVGTNLVAY